MYTLHTSDSHRTLLYRRKTCHNPTHSSTPTDQLLYSKPVTHMELLLRHWVCRGRKIKTVFKVAGLFAAPNIPNKPPYPITNVRSSIPQQYVVWMDFFHDATLNSYAMFRKTTRGIISQSFVKRPKNFTGLHQGYFVLYAGYPHKKITVCDV